MHAVSRELGWLGRWCGRHHRWFAAGLVAAAVGLIVGSVAWAVVIILATLAPGLICARWYAVAPVSYDRLVAGPSRRLGWWWHARWRWQRLARVCRLADRQVVGTRLTATGSREVAHWVVPRLERIRTRSTSIELTIRARAGQTLAELEGGAERLATTFGAIGHRVAVRSGSSIVVELVMLDRLAAPRIAAEPEPRARVDTVSIGRRQSGAEWELPIRGRHTLIAGCSGAGKGSVLWSICGGLAPAVRTDMVRLWGIDLKRGVELAMGEGLFTARAYTPRAALEVLRDLLVVIDARGASMVGRSRLHEPTVGDPLHVLVIDELAALTAYAEPEVRRDAGRLLGEILTQGRALGVVVVACVQDPRKEVVSMRGLFTQTVALRLRSVEETVMVLGEGMTQAAPAHRISPAAPGTGWVVEDTGTTDRVRADLWPDDLVRDIACRYSALPTVGSVRASEDVA